MRVLAVIVLLPLIEIFTFAQVGGKIGGLWTVLLTLATAMLGVLLIKTQGGRTISNVKDQLQQGQMPAQAVVGGIMTFISGAFLLLPGFISDALGLILLLPPVQAVLAQSVIQSFMKGRMQGSVYTQGQNPHAKPQGGNTIEGEFRREDD